LWLYGLAGSGKSAFSTAIAWMTRDFQWPSTFFFFDRDEPARNAATLARTLAYQLVLLDARFDDTISRIVEAIPHIAEISDHNPLIGEGNGIGGMVWRSDCTSY
jgi:hypothetical protein